MLEDTVERFTNRLKGVILTDERMTSIPLAYLMRLDIPDSVKHFFDQEVELWLREEENKFTTNERFDYDMPEVRLLIDQVFDILKQSATFHISKFSHLLERAVKLQMNFLIEPHRTLSQFLFKDSPVISTMEVIDTFKYFFKFDYYRTTVSEYFDQKYLREISQDQFDDLMNQIDQKAFSENQAETMLSTLKTVIEFLSEATEENVNVLSTDILYAAFRDRKLEGYMQLVNKARDNNISELKFDEVERLLRESLLPGQEEEPEETTIIGFEETESLEKAQPEVSVADIEMQEPEIVLEEEQEEEEYEEEEAGVEYEEDEGAEQEIVSTVADDLADHVAQQISSNRPLEDLNMMIVGRARRKIIKKLFKKNEDEYLNFVEQINALSTWKEASRIIEDEFYEKGINPYSKEALSFSDICYVRFFPKDKYVSADDGLEKF